LSMFNCHLPLLSSPAVLTTEDVSWLEDSYCMLELLAVQNAKELHRELSRPTTDCV
jgi:hypothetical protein